MSVVADLGWLFVFILSWAAPLALDSWRGLSYFGSLLIWLIRNDFLH